MNENNSIAQMYNAHLKGRYAYWVQMRYIVPFDFMKHEGYVACEEDITKLLQKVDGSYPKPYGCPYVDMYSENRCIMKYIDLEATDAANSISKYVLENNKATSDDITISMLRNFRTWLAQSILDMDNMKDELDDIRLDENEKHTMAYYANGMFNDIVKYLNIFNNINTVSTSTSCGCCSSESLSSFNIVDCDALSVYRKNIYNKMVEMFSNVEFWKQYPVYFLELFKKYIDNIIRVGFKINNSESQYISVYKDCTCNSNEDSNNTSILKRLSEALKYMINNEEKSHKNFIYDALYDWASLLYEFMVW